MSAALEPIARWRDDAATDPRRDTRTAAILGIALGVCFATCFLTGLYSHLAQHPPGWFELPASPSALYQVTQGVHVATGIATIPLLLAKLWAVFPHLFGWPPITGVAHALERLALVPLVAGSIFMLFSGLANTYLWYPLPVFFPTAHYWVAWLTIGALVTHIGAKLALTRQALGRTGPSTHPAAGTVAPSASPASDDPASDDPASERSAAGVAADPDPATRRRFLATVGAAAGLLTVATVGQTVYPLRRLALLAPRNPDIGTDGFPVNNTAVEAGITEAATDPAWRLSVTGAVGTALSLSIDDLRALPQHEAVLPIACVEGWSATKRWRGVRLADVLARAGAAPDASATLQSLERGLFGTSDVNPGQAHHPDTLLALEVEGSTLSLDHGYPVRLIAPNRPGVMQTKWLSSIEVHR